VALAGPSVYETGRIAGTGSFVCLECGFAIALAALDSVPECPTCGGSRFRRSSLFEQTTVQHQAPVENAPEEPEWLRHLRHELDEEGQFLCFQEDGGDAVKISIPAGWTRIGRSVSADIRLDDPTVSRRHALIVKTENGRLRVLDDRSLNGVFVNGHQVEWSRLADGDELAIGRYHLHVVDTVAARRRLNPAALDA
jgi:predicted RNA-binding Zn-ribbon protein involved in translation (DUF1610 family)